MDDPAWKVRDGARPEVVFRERPAGRTGAGFVGAVGLRAFDRCAE
jgi:hypothetical protein